MKCIYDVHQYAWANEEDANAYPEQGNITEYFLYDKEFLRMKEKYPILIGEFGGFWSADFGKEKDIAFIQNMLEVIETNTFSFTAYTMDPVDEDVFPNGPLEGLALFTTNGQVTRKGEIFKHHLAQYPPSVFATPTPIPTPTPTPTQSPWRKLVYWLDMFLKKASSSPADTHVSPTQIVPSPTMPGSLKNLNNWREDFTHIDTAFWEVVDNEALEGAWKHVHQGYFKKDHVSIADGHLVLKLTQEYGPVGNNKKGVISKGAELKSRETFGYGTYEWRMRMSSTSPDPYGAGTSVPGQISAGFVFLNNSQTEIDFEVEGQYPDQLEMTTYKNPDTTHFPTASDRIYTFKKVPDMITAFHTYKFIWTSDQITYYVDDVLVADHKKHVPDTPAHFMINHWGTNSPNFGGEARVGIDRYMLIDWVRYTASR